MLLLELAHSRFFYLILNENMSGNTIMKITIPVERQYLKVNDQKHDCWSNQKLLNHFQHAKKQVNSSIYS